MPGSTGAIRAGRAFVEMFLDQSGLTRGLKDALGKLRAWGTAVNALGRNLFIIGGGILAPLAAAAKEFADFGSALIDASDRTGIAVEDLAALRYAAEQTGASFEDLETGIKHLQKNLSGGENSKAVRELRKQLKDMPADARRAGDALEEMNQPARFLPEPGPLGAPERGPVAAGTVEQLRAVAELMKKAPNEAQRTRIALDLLGKSGTKLKPMLKEGAAGLDQFIDRAHKLGLILGREDAEAADRLGDLIDDLTKTLRMVAVAIGSAVAPVLSDLLEEVLPVIGAVTKWVKNNRGLVVQLLKIGAILAGTGAAILLVSYAVSGLITVGTVLWSVLGLLVASLKLFFITLAPITLPLLAAIITIGALAAAFLYLTESGSKAREHLGAGWDGILATFKDTFGGIINALQGGDLELAGRIAMQGLKLAWTQGIGALEMAWLEFKDWVLDIGMSMFFDLLRIAVDWEAGLRSIWVDATTGLTLIWDDFLLGLKLLALDFAAGWIQIASSIQGVFQPEEAKKAREQGMAEISRQSDAAIQRRAAKEQQTIDQRNARQQRVEQDRRNWQMAITTAQQQEGDQRKAEKQARFDEINAGIDAERKKLDDLLAEAAAKAGLPPPPPPPPKAGADFGESVGTFNAFALRGLGENSFAQRQAEAAEEAVDLLNQLLQEAQLGGTLA